MGAVDLVIQVESPKSVTRGLQRIGRAGHGLGEVSKGRIFPKFRGDLLECAVVARRMRDGRDRGDGDPPEPARRARPAPRLDGGPRRVGGRRGRAPRHRLASPSTTSPASSWRTSSTCSTGATPPTASPSCARGSSGTAPPARMHGRKGARQLVVTNAGTIPDRGLYGVHLPDGRRVGELDEEMVYEARPGQTFLLGATTWRIEEITRDRVIVTPAPGAPGAVPFWKGDGIGRPAELGRAIGAFAREAVSREPDELAVEYDLDRRAAENLVAYLREQQAATRVVPSDETIVVERFRDEIGDWRLCVLSPFGGRVHAAWGLALAAKIRAERDLEADAIWSDDGIVIHLPDADEPPPADLVLIEPDELEDLVVGELSGLGPVRRPLPRERLPLAADPPRLPRQAHAALAAAAEGAEPARGGAGLPPLPGHPRDLPRVPARRARPALARRAAARPALAPAQPGRGRDADRLALRLLAALRLRRHLHVRGGHAERRAARGGAGARPRPAARAARPGGAARADRPRGAGGGRGAAPAPHRGRAGRATATRCSRCCATSATSTAAECAERVTEGYSAESMLEKLVGERRAARVRIGGEERYVAAEDAGLYRDALGVPPPAGPAGDLPRGPPRRDARPGPPLRPHPRPLPDRPPRRPLRRRPGPGAARAGGRRGAGPRRAAAGRDRARVVRLRRAAPGAARQPRPSCGARSRRPTAPSSPASCRAGRTSTPTAAPAPAPTACARRWCRCRASR